jgi:hypothetical protein
MTAPVFRFWTDTDLENLPPVSWLLTRILNTSGLAVLYGPSGVGKSFVALALAVAVALDRECLGRAVQGGRVVYLAAEGGRTLGPRINALKDWHEVEVVPGLTVVPDAVYLHDARHLTAFLAQLREKVATPIALTIIDTLSRCSAGSDESSNADREMTVEGLNHIRAATDGAILAVHHTGWNEDRMRGASSLQAAADTILALKRSGGGVELKVEKQRDGEAGETIDLQLQPYAESLIVTVGVSVGVVPEKAVRLLKTLDEISLSEGMSDTAWKESSAMPQSSYYGLKKTLVVGGYVEPVHGSKKWVVSLKGHELLQTPKLLQVTPRATATYYSQTHPPKGVELECGALETLEVGDAWEPAA